MATSYSPGKNGSFVGIDAKYWTLIALVIQNAATVLLLHHSCTMPTVRGQRFYASTAILLAEIIKLAFAATMALYEIATSLQRSETPTIGELARAISRAVFSGDSWKLAIPASLYVVQNSLQYVAASNLDLVVFAVTCQLKLVSTAVFNGILNGRVHSLKQWLSLAAVGAGVGVVDLSALARAGKSGSGKSVHVARSAYFPEDTWGLWDIVRAAADHLSKRSATYEGIHSDFEAAYPQPDVVTGLAAALAACLLSGVASVYFEKLLKVKGEYSKSIWIRNVQLTFYAIWPALFLGVLFLDGEHIAKTGFFAGYDSTVLILILFQAVGGILVASSLAQASAGLKCLAMLPSTLIVVLAGVFFLDLSVTLLALLGIVSSLGGTLTYGYTSTMIDARPPSINVTHHEKSDFRTHLDGVAGVASGTSPLLDVGDKGVSTSRSSSPFSERRKPRSKSVERLLKREQ